MTESEKTYGGTAKKEFSISSPTAVNLCSFMSVPSCLPFSTFCLQPVLHTGRLFLRLQSRSVLSKVPRLDWGEAVDLSLLAAPSEANARARTRTHAHTHFYLCILHCIIHSPLTLHPCQESNSTLKLWGSLRSHKAIAHELYNCVLAYAFHCLRFTEASNKGKFS